MKVRNMTSNRTGREVPNQFVINDDYGNTFFQSYRTVIAVIRADMSVMLDPDWDYSRTTGKYRNQFLNETRRNTERKIKDGTYKIASLNKS